MTELSPEILELEPQEAVTVRGEVAIADLPHFFERAFGEAAAAAAAAGADIVGPPFAYYPDMPTETVVVEAGFPVATPVADQASAHRLVLPGGRAVRVIHVGPYEAMEQTYQELQSWMAHHGVQPAVGMWECYLSDPRVERDPATWRTAIVWPLA